MRHWVLLLVVVVGCAPSRDAAFAPTRAEIERRTGQSTSWHADDPLARETDAIVADLLAEELTFDAAAQIALLNDRRLQARFADIGVARAELLQSGLLANPTLEGEVLFPVTADQVQGGVGLQFDFLSSLFRAGQRDVAVAQLEATQLAVAGAAIDVAFAARAALVDFVGLRQGMEALERAGEAAALSQEVAERLFEAGNVTELSYLQERALSQDVRARVLRQRAELVRARRQVDRALGLVDDQTEWRSVAALPALPAGDDGAAMLEREALAQSLDLELGRRRVDVAGQALGLTSARRFIPDLEVGVAGEQEDDGLLAGPTASITLPLLDQGQAQVAAREAELRGVLERYVATRAEVQAEARRVGEQLVVARERASVLGALVPLRERTLAEGLLQYNAMAIGVFELLHLKREELEARVEYADALRDYWKLRLAADQLRAGRRPSFAMALEGAGDLDEEPTGGQPSELGGDE